MSIGLLVENQLNLQFCDRLGDISYCYAWYVWWKTNKQAKVLPENTAHANVALHERSNVALHERSLVTGGQSMILKLSTLDFAAMGHEPSIGAFLHTFLSVGLLHLQFSVVFLLQCQQLMLKPLVFQLKGGGLFHQTFIFICERYTLHTKQLVKGDGMNDAVYSLEKGDLQLKWREWSISDQ